MEKGLKSTTADMDSELRRARRKAIQASKKDKDNVPTQERNLQQLKNELGDKHISLLNGLNAYKKTKMWTWLGITVDAMNAQKEYLGTAWECISKDDWTPLLNQVPVNENMPTEPTSPPPDSPVLRMTSSASPLRSPTQTSPPPSLSKSPSMGRIPTKSRRMTLRNPLGRRKEKAVIDNESTPAKEGHLQVLKKGKSTWEKRWCQILRSTFQIYKSQSDPLVKGFQLE